MRSDSVFSFTQYTDLAKEPAFDLEALRKDHVARDRDTELARSLAVSLLPKSKKQRAKSSKKQNAEDGEEEDGESWCSDDEEMDYKLSIVEKNRRQEDEAEDEGSQDSFDGGDVRKVDLELRAKSGRVAKRSRGLEDFVVDEDYPPPESAPKKIARRRARGKATASGTEMVLISRPAAAAAAAPARRAPAATRRAAKARPAAVKPGRKARAAAAPAPARAAVASAGAVARPSSVPMRKRRLQLEIDPETIGHSLYQTP